MRGEAGAGVRIKEGLWGPPWVQQNRFLPVKLLKTRITLIRSLAD